MGQPFILYEKSFILFNYGVTTTSWLLANALSFRATLAQSTFVNAVKLAPVNVRGIAKVTVCLSWIGDEVASFTFKGRYSMVIWS